jgi:hypothetical protein
MHISGGAKVSCYNVDIRVKQIRRISAYRAILNLGPFFLKITPASQWHCSTITTIMLLASGCVWVGLISNKEENDLRRKKVEKIGPKDHWLIRQKV